MTVTGVVMCECYPPISLTLFFCFFFVNKGSHKHLMKKYR
uniref:Uncharacterized protein n=1 Tax=Anguilla anguilla TaxID=7936 RepID=A0A0E9RN18_ANGAN